MKLQFNQLINQVLTFPKKEIDAFWELGEFVEIQPNTILDTPDCLLNSIFYMHEGITRDYFSDENGVEYTSRFNMAPDFIARAILTQGAGIKSEVIGSSLTPLIGRQWNFETMETFAKEVPRGYKLLSIRTLMSIEQKEISDRRRSQLSIKDQYKSLILEYPNLINSVPLKYISSYLRIRPETLSRIRAEKMNK